MTRFKLINNKVLFAVCTVLLTVLIVGCPEKASSTGNNDLDDDQKPIENPTTKIALHVTDNRAEGVRKVLGLLDFPSMAGKNVVVKPNFNTADPSPASTHNETLEQIMTEIHSRGAVGITLAERSYQAFDEVIAQKAIDVLADEKNFRIVNLDNDEYILFEKEGLHWRNGFRVPRTISESEYIVATCCLKTHHTGVITMSLKLGVGILPRSHMQELHSSSRINSMIAEINLAYKPDIIILDGVKAFIEGGPSRGTVATGNVILAGTDRIAVDVVGAAMLEYLGSTKVRKGSIFDLEQIQRAVELNLGIKYPSQIEIVTDDSASAALADELKAIIDEG
ncbi:MAG: DUF362 domain-containing protein [Candidatus Neomarinimicrobiota bacterium]